MDTFRILKKAAKEAVNGEEFRLAILGNTATQFLATATCGYGKEAGINLNVFDSDYNQIDTQLLDLTSETYEFNPDVILLYLSTDKLYEDFLDASIVERSTFADTVLSKIERYWNLIEKNCSAKILQTNFTEINDAVLGNYSAKTEISFIYQISLFR